MAACILRVDADTTAAAIQAARDAADSPAAVDDYRTAMLDAMAARDAGQDPGAILRALWRGAYIAGHLDGAVSARGRQQRAEAESNVLGALLELTGSKR
jgi:hypothetical protein